MNHECDMYPAYDRSERIADATIHALGVLFALGGTGVVLYLAATQLTGGQFAALGVYTLALSFSLCASALYHFTPWEKARPLFRRIDHAAIYLKIAGTDTPLVVLIGSAFAYAVLVMVWGVAIFAAVLKLFFWRRPGKLGPLMYLALGWASLLIVWSLFPLLPVRASVLIAVGGLLYSAGVIFFNWERLRFSLAIWHGFVLGGSGCFFTAITMGSFATL